MIFGDLICDWNFTQSIFFRTTQCKLYVVPSLQEILIPACIILLFHIVVIGLLTCLGYWYTNSFWVGYLFVIIIYLLPELTKLQIAIGKMGLYYTDYCLEQSVMGTCTKRVVMLFGVSIIMVVLGLIRRKKDFLS